MKNHLRCALLAALAFALSSPAIAGDLKLSMQGGRVTIIARDVPLRTILQEWARVGQTQIINGDKVAAPPMTIELIDVPEAQALDTLLRSAAGYMAAPRPVALATGSVYDRIMILAVSRPPAASAAPPPPAPFQPRPQPMPVDDDDEPVNVAPMPNPAMPNPGMPNPGMPNPAMPNTPMPTPQTPVVPFPGGPNPTPLQPTPGQAQPVQTAPRPGALPVPTNPNGPPNPYGPTVVRPGGPGGPGESGGPGQGDEGGR